MMEETPILLVVDDEPLNLAIIGEFLEPDGYRLVDANDGEQAWNILRADPGRFSAVILDRMMPGMDGMEVLRRIKHDAALRALPVIMQTAAAAPDQVAEGIAAGAFYYLTKPFGEEVLRAVVRSALADAGRQRTLLDDVAHVGNAARLLAEGTFRFRTPGEARALAVMLSHTCPDAGMVSIGLAELMLNAVEHGNLEISYLEKTELLERQAWNEEMARRLADPRLGARHVETRVRRENGAVIFEIADEGTGFDWRSYLEISVERVFDSHGRGIALARQLSFSRVEYLGCGNVVRASVSLADPGFPGDF